MSERNQPLNLGTLEPEGSNYSFKNLLLWQKAQELTVVVAKLVDRLPRRRSADAIAMQLLRATSSVAANIAEGHGRFSFAAYRNHLSIAKGSAAEARSWVDLASRLDYFDPEMTVQLDSAMNELIASLTRRMRALEAQESAAKRRNGSKVPRFKGSASTPQNGGPE